MVLHDIFSKGPTKEKKSHSEKSVSIIVDTREKQSLVAANLSEQKARYEFKKLEVGDYAIGPVLIERKTISDLISSLQNKRLHEQLSNLKKSEKPLLLIEGFLYEYKNKYIHENSLRGLFASIALKFQIPVLFTKDESDTAKLLVTIAKKEGSSKQTYSLRHTKKQKSFQEQKRFVLEGFPGIGPSLSKRLLKKYKSLKEIFRQPIDELKKIEKFDEKKIKEFKRVLEM